MKTVRARRRSARAPKTLTLAAFLCGAVWLAATATGPAASALGQSSPGPPPAAAQGPPAPVAAPEAEGDAAARAFLQKCAGCHTVGRGKLSGPDLNGAAAWPVPDLSRAIKAMETRVGPLADDEVARLAEFLKDPDVGERIRAEEARVARAAAVSLEPPSAEAGAALFSGRAPLANGGAACAACHAVNGSGGTLGPDLTGVHAKLGQTALASAVEKASYRIMSAAYRDHPVTVQEALHLTEYLAAAEGRATLADPPVAAIGAAAAVVALVALAYAYRRRAPGVRRRMMRRRRDGVD